MVGSKLFGVQIGYATGIVLAAIQIHHFFVDGVIWKLKSSSVSSPLMVNLDDLIHEKTESLPPMISKNVEVVASGADVFKGSKAARNPKRNRQPIGGSKAI